MNIKTQKSSKQQAPCLKILDGDIGLMNLESGTERNTISKLEDLSAKPKISWVPSRRRELWYRSTSEF